MHEDLADSDKSHYWVMAKLCEPKYDTEQRFVLAELAYAKRKAEHRESSLFSEWSWPALGVFDHKDWRKYAHDLEHYERKLQKYRKEVAAGVLPIKFAVINRDDTEDAKVKVHVQVKRGRIDVTKKAPERPERLDGRGKSSKLKWPKLGGFSRSGIKITAHSVAAEFSGLGSSDGAVLVNQLVHLHCGDETTMNYEIRSRNVAHEVGEVELQELTQS